MPAFSPTAQPTGVGPSGATAQVTIPPGYRRFRINRFLTTLTSGSATSFDVDINTDPSFPPLRRIASCVGGTMTDPADFDNGGEGYVWDGEEANGEIYIRVIPNLGNDNNFLVRVFVGWRL